MNGALTNNSWSALEAVDWSFPDSKAARGIHGIHPYPAKFIPEIPRTLLKLLPLPDGALVLDPFCGSGTTLVETQAAGFAAVGIDVNPLAALLSKVKTTRLQEPITPIAAELVERAASTAVPIPSIPNLDHWFEPDVQGALAGLVALIGDISDQATRDALRVALSSIIVRVSNQESDTRYAAVRKEVGPRTVFEEFEKAAGRVEDALAGAFWGLFERSAPVTVLNRDTLSVTADDLQGDVSLVITSPPYPNAYEYWLYHKYRMYWLGLDPISARKAEIGARPHYFKKNPQTEVDFESQMGRCFGLLSTVMLPGAIACFLVGPSVIHARQIDNAAILQRAAKLHGFSLVGRFTRHIPQTRKAFNPAHGRITEEALLVFEVSQS